MRASRVFGDPGRRVTARVARMIAVIQDARPPEGKRAGADPSNRRSAGDERREKRVECHPGVLEGFPEIAARKNEQLDVSSSSLAELEIWRALRSLSSSVSCNVRLGCLLPAR